MFHMWIGEIRSPSIFYCPYIAPVRCYNTMVQKRLLQRTAGAAALGAVVLGAAGFANARTAPQNHPAAPVRVTQAHVLQYVNIDSGLFPKTFDPANVTDSQSIQVLPMLYGNLVKLDTQNRVMPDLAQSISVSKDRKTYTFTLRDTKFSDGKPVTADDVIYSITRALNPKVYKNSKGVFGPSPVAGLYLGHIVGATAYNGGKASSVAGLKKVDSKMVRIALDSPISFFLQTLSYPTADILEKGKTPIAGLVTTNPTQNQVSSGPFKISAYRYKSSLSFVPNPGYYNYKSIKLKRVDMPFVADFDTNYQGFKSGQYTIGFIPSRYLSLERSQSDFHAIPTLALDYISYNFKASPFSNKNLRLAMSYAIDRDRINNEVLHGSQTSVYSVVPKGIPGYDEAGKNYTPHYDLAKAKQYLAAAKKELGNKFPSSIIIRYQNSGADIGHEYTELQYEWKQLGVNVQPQSVDFNSWLNLVAKSAGGHEPWVENAWIDDYPDAQDFTTNLLDPSSDYNIGNYNNPQFNALTTKALTTPNGSTRDQLYVKASRIALNDAAWSVVGQSVYSYRWSPSIKGLTMWSGEIYPVPVNNDWTNVDVQ